MTYILDDYGREETHTHTHTQNTPLSLSVSLSLTHTHTHTHTYLKHSPLTPTLPLSAVEADLECPFSQQWNWNQIRFILSCPMCYDLRGNTMQICQMPITFLTVSVVCFWKTSISKSDLLLFCKRLLLYAILSGLDRCCTCNFTLIESCLTVFITTIDMAPWPFSINRSVSLSQT